MASKMESGGDASVGKVSNEKRILFFKKYGLISLAVAILFFLVLILLKSAREAPVDARLDREAQNGLGYHLTIKAIDPDDHVAQLSVKPVFNEFGSVIGSGTNGIPACDYDTLVSLVKPTVHCTFLFGPLTATDLSTDFQYFGTSDDFAIDVHPDSRGAGPMSEELPGEQGITFQILGDPSSYPFDKYLLIGAAREDVLLKINGKDSSSAKVEEGLISFSFTAPGYTFRAADERDLAYWAHTIFKTSRILSGSWP